MFEHIQPYAGDPIFALVDAYNAALLDTVELLG